MRQSGRVAVETNHGGGGGEHAGTGSDLTKECYNELISLAKQISEYLCQITPHPPKLCNRLYILSREISHWLQSSVTRIVLRGLIAILKVGWLVHNEGCGSKVVDQR